MKKPNNPVLTEELAKVLYKCIVCQRPNIECYGRWENGVTCRKSCEEIQATKPKDYGENDPAKNRSSTR